MFELISCILNVRWQDLAVILARSIIVLRGLVNEASRRTSKRRLAICARQHELMALLVPLEGAFLLLRNGYSTAVQSTSLSIWRCTAYSVTGAETFLPRSSLL